MMALCSLWDKELEIIWNSESGSELAAAAGMDQVSNGTLGVAMGCLKNAKTSVVAGPFRVRRKARHLQCDYGNTYLQ